MINTDIKDTGKNTEKKSNKYKHVKTLLMIQLLDLNSSSVTITFPTIPTRYLLVVN